MSLLSISLLRDDFATFATFSQSENKYEIILFKLDVGGQVKNILPVTRHG